MLQFEEASHTYMVNGVKLRSVSEIVASQFKKFNSHVISRMIARKKAEDETSEYFNMTADDIMNKWNETGKQSRDAGTRMHHLIENFYKHCQEPEDESVEWKQFEEFRKENPDWICLATEHRVHNNKVAGTIDAIFDTPEGVVLVDWKRTKAIDYSGHGMGKDHMKHVADCNYSKYSLQLSLYRALINCDVHACYIVQIHPSLETYQKIKAQNFHIEAKKLLE
jgi:ATP-dependent exoDNAse (exonuclease V) beta subunit